MALISINLTFESWILRDSMLDFRLFSMDFPLPEAPTSCFLPLDVETVDALVDAVGSLEEHAADAAAQHLTPSESRTLRGYFGAPPWCSRAPGGSR